jgi:hypothetical protein
MSTLAGVAGKGSAVSYCFGSRYLNSTVSGAQTALSHSYKFRVVSHPAFEFRVSLPI